jgi:hypothetical protein
MDRRLLTLLWGVMACTPRVPVPPTGPHVGDEPVEVPYPPPPARAEVLPPEPRDDALWIDGYWSWTGSDYAWVPGSWQPPRAGYYYAPATTVRRRNGGLLYFEGHWHPEAARSK